MVNSHKSPGEQKTKVIHIITRFDKGGSAENTFLTALELNKERYTVILIKGLANESNLDEKESTAVNKNLETLQENGIFITTIPSLVRNLNPLKDCMAFFSLWKIMKTERPDIVHTHTSKAGFLGRWAAYFAGVPIVIHTPHGHVFHSYFNPVITKIFIVAERISSVITDKIITLTERERDEHIHEKIAPAEKFVTIPSGVSLERFNNIRVDIKEKRGELGIPDDAFVIGTVGRLVPIKGHQYLISALPGIIKKFPRTVLLLVGDGHLKPKLEEQAKSLNIRDYIIFCGWRHDIPEVITLFDILVFPSLNEGMGRVLIEGMALGKPIIASDVGGIKNLIKKGINGILVPPADEKALEEALLHLMENSSLADKLGKEGKNIAFPDFDASTMVTKIDNLYRELLKRKHS
jgi:glycosyltransferase involved in cell wall biosynthesis